MSAPSFKQILGIAQSSASSSDSALLIIDAQNEYQDGKLAISNIKTSRPAIEKLLSTYRSKGGKIVHIRHKVPSGAPVFTPDTPLADEFQELKPQDGEETVIKQYPGSFEQTKLKEILDGWGIKKVVLCGYMAHVCVSTTAREAYQKGFEVILAEEAIGDRDIPGAKGDEVTKMVLLELNDTFGTVLKTSDIN